MSNYLSFDTDLSLNALYNELYIKEELMDIDRELKILVSYSYKLVHYDSLYTKHYIIQL